MWRKLKTLRIQKEFFYLKLRSPISLMLPANKRNVQKIASQRHWTPSLTKKKKKENNCMLTEKKEEIWKYLNQASWAGMDNDILRELDKTQTEIVDKPLYWGKDRFSRENCVLKYVKCLSTFTHLCKCAHQHGAYILPSTGSGRSHVCWHSFAGSHHSPPHTRPHLEKKGRWWELQDSLSKDIPQLSWTAGT